MQTDKNSFNFKLADSTNLQSAYVKMVHLFEDCSIEDAQFDANQLIYYVTGKDKRIFAQDTLSIEQAETLTKLALKRSKRYPLQYLLGEWDFLNFTLKIGEGVLIPRQDTEIVCNTAILCANKIIEAKQKEKDDCENEGSASLNKQVAGQAKQHLCKNKQIKGQNTVNVADLCSGSGAIAIGVAKNVALANVTAVELYDKAYEYLVQNIKTLAPCINVVNSDIFKWQNTLKDDSFDIIVCNPPYVTQHEMKSVQPELDYEPLTALMAQNNGLEFYIHIAAAYKAKIKKGGYLIFEIGSTQAKSVAKILLENGYEDIEIIKDDFNNDRCIKAIAK